MTLQDVSNLKQQALAAIAAAQTPEALEARILERVALFELLCELVLELFRLFLSVRLAADWPEELARVRAWVAEGPEHLR